MDVLRRLPGVLITSVLLSVTALVGFFASPNRGERFDAKTIVLEPAVSGGLRITEFVDIDFGHLSRHGYERILRTDFGEPTDVEAYSSSVSDQIWIDDGDGEVGIRIGDPDVVVSGRHRFVLAFTLADTPMDNSFNLSVIDPGEELETGRFTVVLDGFRLDDALCSVGDWGEFGGCELVDGEVGQQVVFEPLPAGAGINLSGAVTVLGEPVGVDPGSTFPPIDDPSTGWRAGLVFLVALGAGILVIRRSIKRGSNEVAAVDAGGAAYPVPGASTRRVTDDELLSMATVEFAPPDGVSPWEGRVLLDEAVGTQTVSAWISSQLGSGVLTADERDGTVSLSRTEVAPTVDDLHVLESLVPGGSRTIEKRYSAGFAEVWSEIENRLTAQIGSRNWWTRMGSRLSRRGAIGASILVSLLLSFIVFVTGAALRATGSSAGSITGNVFAAVGIAAVAGAIIGVVATLSDRAARTATGSAAFLRVESFRRFLAASEATHVEQALERGVLREYTAWAVALGEAEAWERAAQALGDAAVMTTVTTTAFMHHHVSTFSSATTTPSSSGGGGGGGVGGGGGGGSSGSW